MPQEKETDLATRLRPKFPTLVATAVHLRFVGPPSSLTRYGWNAILAEGLLTKQSPKAE